MLTRKKLRSCPAQHKKCYPTQTAAIRAALYYSRKRGTPLRAYFHHRCKSWHLTHTAKVDTNRERTSA